MHPDCAARFLSPEAWVQAPRDWPIHTQTEKRYDLTTGEGARVWHECVAVATSLLRHRTLSSLPVIAEPTAPRYGLPTLITPRLGQGTFRVAVTEAYGKGCAITDEHSLPALEAAHIKTYAAGGPHEVRNGLLLRADLHRLFDQGYLTVTPDRRVEISRRLREDFANGRSYYPYHGHHLRGPASAQDQPLGEYLLKFFSAARGPTMGEAS